MKLTNTQPVTTELLARIQKMTVGEHAVAIYHAIVDFHNANGMSGSKVRVQLKTRLYAREGSDPSNVLFNFEVYPGEWEYFTVTLDSRRAPYSARNWYEAIPITVLTGCYDVLTRDPRRDCSKSADPLVERVNEMLNHWRNRALKELKQVRGIEDAKMVFALNHIPYSQADDETDTIHVPKPGYDVIVRSMADGHFELSVCNIGSNGRAVGNVVAGIIKRGFEPRIEGHRDHRISFCAQRVALADLKEALS